MEPFLKQTASAYYGRGNMENLCFIFPNRRSMVFFRKYLAEVIASGYASGKDVVPLIAPESYTINDFFSKLYGKPVSDRVSLLIDLYGCYSRLNPDAETLDDFIYWGDVLLADFNDVDKYLADPSSLYANVSDFKSLQDSYSYLTDNQRKAIEQFVSHFSDRNGGLTVDLGSGNPNVKERFLRIWNILSPLYEDFRKRLSAEGKAYEGMVYRSVAEDFRMQGAAAILEKTFPAVEGFVFVGLNVLNECEKTVLRKMRDAGLAEFCWDYSGALIRDPHNRSSFFMDENVREFPQSVSIDPDGVKIPEISVVSVPSSVGQVKQLPEILGRIARGSCGGDLSKVGGLSPETCAAGADCAIVLPDESLLMPVLNTIPPEIRDINVTMGYPMTASDFHVFMTLVSALQMNMRKKGDKWYFYHKHVWALFSNAIFMNAAGEEGKETAARVKASSELYISQEALSTTRYFSTVFRPVVTDRNKASKETVDALSSYLLEVIGSTASTMDRSGMELEFAREYHDCITALRRAGLRILPQTWLHLLKQLLSSVSVPFKGEPLRGLQIMGPLETRALDFSNLIVMSANEGMFPRRSISSSFIPPELRRGFGLPTYEYQDSVWAYYFYRMLARASRVWLLYDSRTEGLKSGEESRYIKQLQYHFNLPLHRYVVDAALSCSGEDADIPKTAADVEAIRNMVFSASSLQTYLACPVKFYYQYVRCLKSEDEVAETLDNGMFGSIYHAVMQALYMGEEAMASDMDFNDRQAVSAIRNVLGEITGDYLNRWLKDRDGIRAKVFGQMMKEIHAMEITGRNLVVGDVIVHYVMKTLERDLELLGRHGTDRFRILGLEKPYSIEFDGFRIKGYVDRLDSFDAGEVRVVDYKTGRVTENDENINDGNAEQVADAIFGENNAVRPKIALQLYIYDKFLRQDKDVAGKRVVNCIYSTSRLFKSPPESFEVSADFHRLVDERLSRLFGQMTDTSVPFRRTADGIPCTYCDFKMICGR